MGLLSLNHQEIINQDLKSLENGLESVLDIDNELGKYLRTFLFSSAKRLRPLLGILFLRTALGNVSESQMNILIAVELIHNATLIHDDVIDEASTRRGNQSINEKFDESLAVVAGDFLLSTALEKVVETSSIQVVNEFTKAMKQTCLGEINQYFSKFSVPIIEDYINKSMLKTALLFEVGISASLLVEGYDSDTTLFKIGEEFARNFGIAFQIRDDLINVLQDGNDLEAGVYNAPVIFAAQSYGDDLCKNNIREAIDSTDAIEKTRTLMNSYFDKSISSLDGLQQNEYILPIRDLIDNLRTNI